MAQRKDQRTEKVKPTLATKIFQNLQAKPAHQIDGWARQRQSWGEDDHHRRRGPVSPLGGKARK